MSHKAKAILEDGEAFVIATLEFWTHLIQMYESMVETPGDEWAEAAEFIRTQVQETLHYETEVETEDWE